MVWYELPGLMLNRREFIDSRDTGVYRHALVYSTYSCSGASTVGDVLWRREGDKAFVSLVEGVDHFRPCGHVSMSLFLDKYRLFLAGGAEVSLEESDLALPTDEDIYRDQIDAVQCPQGSLGGNSSSSDSQCYKIDGQLSWIRGRTTYEHWKVWLRTPVSPYVRNLWARVPGGLQAGRYNLTLPVNSPIWAEWGVTQKTVVIGQVNDLGSTGACYTLGMVCASIALAEFMMAFVLLNAPWWPSWKQWSQRRAQNRVSPTE
mmetsp:Transcript_38352/g.69507  ORF Transcript_38352/g.69507 Transcript_38352/m.69507 type:complete len:260 (+) Transcript_38352:1-780(+)